MNARTQRQTPKNTAPHTHDRIFGGMALTFATRQSKSQSRAVVEIEGGKDCRMRLVFGHIAHKSSSIYAFKPTVYNTHILYVHTGSGLCTTVNQQQDCGTDIWGVHSADLSIRRPECGHAALLVEKRRACLCESVGVWVCFNPRNMRRKFRRISL